MATCKTSGLDELILTMQELAELPEDVESSMLRTQAEIVAKAIRSEAELLGAGYDSKNANSRLAPRSDARGRQKKTYATGATARSVAMSEPARDGARMKIRVYFSGTRPDGKSAEEIAFLNEYGTRSINARGFVKNAIQKTEKETEKAAFDVYDAWLKSKDL